MSQVIGSTFRSRIPTFNDDASIEEALRVYHYGVDNYSTQPIPNDSIEGNFRTLTTNLSTLDAGAVKRVSLTSVPNVITAQATNVIPITVRAIASQTTPLQVWQNSSSTAVAQLTAVGSMFLKETLSLGSTTTSTESYLFVNQASSSVIGATIKAASDATANLQEWQNNSSNTIASVSPSGKFSTSGYISSGSLAGPSSVSIFANILNVSHKGIVVKSIENQEENLQEWQNFSGQPLSWVDNNGKIYVNGNDLESSANIVSFMLMGS